MKNRSVSVTGATGFVGWHVADAFRAAGWHVRAIVRPGSTKPLPAGVEAAQVPLAMPALAEAVAHRDLIVHCAGVIRARDYAAFAVGNVDATRAVVEAANTTNARVLLISSLAAGGVGTVDRPRRESDPPRPVNDYGRSKLAGEDIVRSNARTPWTILRPCAAYGPRDRGFLPLFRLSRRGLFLLPTRASMPFTLIDVADLARAVILASESDRAVGETIAVGHPQPHTTDDILRTLADVFSRRYRPVGVPGPAVRAMAALGDLSWALGYRFVFDSGRLAEFNAEGFVCSVDRARDVLGFTASTALDEGFKRAAMWYQRERWI